MHAPLTSPSKVEAPGKTRFTPAWLIGAAVIACAGVGTYLARDTLHDWLFGPRAAAVILVSGNIEAHQSVLGF